MAQQPVVNSLTCSGTAAGLQTRTRATFKGGNFWTSRRHYIAVWTTLSGNVQSQNRYLPVRYSPVGRGCNDEYLSEFLHECRTLALGQATSYLGRFRNYTVRDETGLNLDKLSLLCRQTCKGGDQGPLNIRIPSRCMA